MSRQYAREYWRQPGGGDPDLPDTALPETLRLTGQPPRPWRLSRTEAREACRALKGMPLREEVYALDGSEAEGRPYLVTEHNYTIELLQPATEPVPDGPQNYHAILLTHARESVTAHYERALYPDGGWRDCGPTRESPTTWCWPSTTTGTRCDRRRPGTGAVTPTRRYPRGPGSAGPATADLHRKRLHQRGGAAATRTARRCPRRRRTFEVVGLRPARRLFGFAELRDGLASMTAELPFQDWDADPAAAARARATADQPHLGPVPARRPVRGATARRPRAAGAAVPELPPGVHRQPGHRPVRGPG